MARDVVQIAASTWAIHGPIAIDGEVIMAAFNSRDAADAAIDELWSAEKEPPPLDTAGDRELAINAVAESPQSL